MGLLYVYDGRCLKDHCIKGFFAVVCHCEMVTLRKGHHPCAWTEELFCQSLKADWWGDFQRVHLGSMFLIMWCIRFGNHLTPSKWFVSWCAVYSWAWATVITCYVLGATILKLPRIARAIIYENTIDSCNEIWKNIDSFSVHTFNGIKRINSFVDEKLGDRRCWGFTQVSCVSVSDVYL